MHAVPNSMKLAIGVGIGLFIALVGFKEAGITVANEATGIALSDFGAGPPLIALGGLAAAIVMMALDRRGALLVGIGTATVLGLASGVLDWPDGIAELPTRATSRSSATRSTRRTSATR